MHDRGFITPLKKLGHRVPVGRRDAVGAHRRFVLPRGQCPEREAFCFRNITPRLPGALLACLNECQVYQPNGNTKRTDRMRNRVTAISGIVKSSVQSVP